MCAVRNAQQRELVTPVAADYFEIMSRNTQFGKIDQDYRCIKYLSMGRGQLFIDQGKMNSEG